MQKHYAAPKKEQTEVRKVGAQDETQGCTQNKAKNAKKKLGVVVFSALTLVMLIIVLIALGSQIRSVWPLSLQLSSPSEISLTDCGAVVLDNSETRISFINENHEATLIADLNPESQHGEHYTTACICNAGCFYSTSTVFDNSAYIFSEQVYYRENIYTEPQLVYRREYDESQQVFSKMFFSIYAVEDGSDVVLVCQNANCTEIETVSLFDTPGVIIDHRSILKELDSLFTISYSYSARAYALVTSVGVLYIVKDDGELLRVNFPGYSYIYDCVWDGKGLLYAIEGSSGALICLDPSDGSQITRTDNTGYTCIATDDAGRYLICGTSAGYDVFDLTDFSEEMGSVPNPVYVLDDPIPYSASLCIWTIAVWVAVVYLAVCVVALGFRIIRSMLRQGKVHELSLAVIIVVAIVAIIGVSLLYSNQYYIRAVDNLENNVSAMCEDIAKTMLPGLINQETPSDDTTEDVDQKLADEIGAALSIKSESYATYNISAEIICMAKTDYAMTSITADAGGYNVQRSSSTSTMDNESFQADAITAKDHAVTAREEYTNGDYIISCRSIASAEGEVIGVALIYCEITDLALSYHSLNISLVMTILAIGGAIALIVVEGKAALDARMRRREEKKRDGGRPEIWSMRQLNFWKAMASGFDSTIAILVAREMLEVQSGVEVDVLIGVPVMLSTFGFFAGTALFGALSSRIGARKICVISGICAGLFFALSAVAVFVNNFWLFCLCRTVAAFSIAVLSAVIGALPLRARNEQTRTKLFEDYMMSGISGVALGTMASGYISEIFGNGAIYLACIIPLVIALLLCLKALPRATKFGETEQGNRVHTTSSGAKGARKNAMLQMFFSPAVIALVVFAMFPLVIFNGYKSVLFPLFMSDAGISKVYINNIVVFSNVIVLVLSSQIARAIKETDRWFVVLACLLCGTATFVWFMVNNSMAWAVLALVLFGFANRLGTPGTKTLLSRAARRYNASETNANNTLGMLEEFETALRSPVLTAFAGFGQSVACFILGAICAVGAGLFTLLSAKSPLRARAQDNPEVDA